MSLPLKHKKTETSFWDKRRGVIHTKNGGLVIGEAVYSHGYDMMEDLVGQVSYLQVMVLNVTGRLPERRLADWLEALSICISYPDARIWCNQIGSLGGTLRASPVAATSAGVLASDSILYGPGTIPAGVEFFLDAVAKKRSGMSVEEIVLCCQRNPKSKPMIVGYARPVVSGDERVEAMERVTKKLGFEHGEYLSLAFEIEKTLVKKTNEKINIVAYGLAFLCEQGFSPKEIYCLMSVIVSAGVVACYAEAADQPPESFFPLQCEDIDYQGKPWRPVPARD